MHIRCIPRLNDHHLRDSDDLLYNLHHSVASLYRLLSQNYIQFFCPTRPAQYILVLAVPKKKKTSTSRARRSLCKNISPLIHTRDAIVENLSSLYNRYVANSRENIDTIVRSTPGKRTWRIQSYAKSFEPTINFKRRPSEMKNSPHSFNHRVFTTHTHIHIPHYKVNIIATLHLG